jgi:hypothetical protein
MARRTKEQEQTPEMSAGFPYEEFMHYPAWRVLQDALLDLESNKDLELRTDSRYVVGFLIKKLAARDLTQPEVRVVQKQKNGHDHKLHRTKTRLTGKVTAATA